MKQKLIEEITTFRKLKGEDSQRRVGSNHSDVTSSPLPQMIDYYSISKRAGDQAMKIVELCKDIAEFNPTPEPTLFFSDSTYGDAAPLNGSWKSLFTTASDADFSTTSSVKKSSWTNSCNKQLTNNSHTRARPKVQNIVDAQKGTITNVVDFPLSSSSVSKDDGRNRLFQLKQLNVVLKAEPLSSTRVGLEFKYAKLIIMSQFKLPRNKVLNFSWPIFIPIPPTFVVRGMVFMNRWLTKLKQKFTKKQNSGANTEHEDARYINGDTKTSKNKGLPPKPYFDVLYLDDDLRIHRTGEDNFFVQGKDTWTSARTLF
jgi:hypothetical protein